VWAAAAAAGAAPPTTTSRGRSDRIWDIGRLLYSVPDFPSILLRMREERCEKV